MAKIERAHYINGQLEYEHPYQNGVKHGVWKGWYRNGQLINTYYYLDGEYVTQEEYRRHELILKLAGIDD